MGRTFVFIFLIVSSGILWASDTSKLQTFRLGSPSDITAKTTAGFALMGGGKDLDEAFKFLCDKSGGGDFVILRASGTDAYNPYVAGLCKQNSETTLVVASREAAQDPAAATAIRNAEAVFIAGGDQANYINFWQGTPVQSELNDAIRRGVPIGGTSAGLAVLGQFSFSALHDSARSPETLADPFNERVTIARDFLHIPLLKRTITDTHFVARDRQGRLLGFMARILQDGLSSDVRAIGVDERAAVLLEPNGSATVVGTGAAAYFYRSATRPQTCSPGKPLTYRDIEVIKTTPGGSFNLSTWSSNRGDHYQLEVVEGAIHSNRADKAIY
jgi:cyanophycinase